MRRRFLTRDEGSVAASVVVEQLKMALAASYDDQRGLLSRRGINRRARLLNWQMMPKRDRGLPLRGRPRELLRPRALGIAFPLSSSICSPIVTVVGAVYSPGMALHWTLHGLFNGPMRRQRTT